MKKKFKIVTAGMVAMLMLLISTITVFASTEIPDRTPGLYVNDFADVLSEEEEQVLYDNAKKLHDEYNKTQVVVSTVDNTGDMETSDYAFEMYNKYKIGKGSRGLLILFSKGEGADHKGIFIATGKAMEAYITDSKAGRFIDNYAMPYFEKEEYAQGLISLQTEIISEIKTQLDNEEIELSNSKEVDFSLIFGIILIIIIIVAILALISLIIKKIKKRRERIRSLEKEIQNLKDEKQRNAILYAQGLESFERRIHILESKLQEQVNICNSVSSELKELQDRYQRAETLYPGMDKSVTDMIEREFIEKCKNEAKIVDSAIAEVVNEESTYKNEMIFKRVLEQYENLNSKSKEYVTGDINSVNTRYIMAVKLREKHEKELEDQRAQSEAKSVEETINSKIGRMSSADRSDLDKLKRLKKSYKNMSSHAKDYFSANLLAKLNNLIEEAEEDQEREEKRRRQEEEEERRRREDSYSYSSFDSGSDFNSGYDGENAGGGAGRDF